MNELDKYFEKARNVEPEYDEDDTRKFLAGKLSDGGIATNLYNKIKVYPMLTALITSVATIATVALLSISSPEIKTEKTSPPKQTTYSVVDLNSNDTEQVKPTDDLLSAVVEETDEAPKVDKTISEPLDKWTDDSNIDVKTVNSLKLTKEELAQLGIEVDRKSFKVNAFDKYKYIIYKNNDKQRDYYDKDEDQDALPTPAMVTTATGFKTLTLFKSGNVEATVDRKRTISKDGKSAEQRITYSQYDIDKDLKAIFKNAPKFDMRVQSFSDYQKSLSGHKDSAEIMKKIESLETLDFTMNGQTMSLDFQKLIGNGNYKNQVLADFLAINPKDIDKSSDEKFELDIKISDKEADDLNILNISKEAIIDLDTSFNSSSEFSNGLEISNVDDFYSKIDTIGENNYVVKSDSPVKIYIHNKNPNMKVVNKEDYKIVGNDTIYEKEWTTVDMDNQNPPSMEELRKAGVKTYHVENVEFVTINNVTMQDSSIVDIKSRATENKKTRKVNVYSSELDRKDIDKIIQATLDSLPNKNTTLIEVDASESPSSNNPNNRTIHIPIESLGEGKKIKIINGNPQIIEETAITEIYEESDDKNNNDTAKRKSSTKNKKYEIKIDGKTFSVDYDEIVKDGILDKEKYKEFILSISKDLGEDISVDSKLSGTESNKVENYQIDINTNLVIEDGENDLKFKLKPGQSVWADENQDGTNNAFSSNMSFDFMNYNINELIPIEISFDGVNTDFIVWYEAKEDFLKKLPTNLQEKINPELAAISEQAQHCDNAPIEKDDAVMDVWSGCSGAIKEMKVFPNPATSNSKVEFSLEDNRQVSIAIYDLSGKLIKRVKNDMSLPKGQFNESLNLIGVNPGMYYVVVKSEIGEQALQRIIIE